MQYNPQQNPNTLEETFQTSDSSLLARNKVLRQTYILLGLNVAFSALCAYLGTVFGMGRIPFIVLMIAMLGLPMMIMANRNSGLGIVLLFAFTGFLGLSLSNILGAYFNLGMGYIVAKALMGSAIIFFALSAYVLATGKNFNFLGGFLFVGMVIAFLCGLAAMFFGMSTLSVVVSGAFLLIFSGYVLYDTSRIIQGEETNYIMATMSLFINIFNIFVSLLNILSAFNSR